jgi:hypothetical protein
MNDNEYNEHDSDNQQETRSPNLDSGLSGGPTVNNNGHATTRGCRRAGRKDLRASALAIRNKAKNPFSTRSTMASTGKTEPNGWVHSSADRQIRTC